MGRDGEETLANSGLTPFTNGLRLDVALSMPRAADSCIIVGNESTTSSTKSPNTNK